MTKAPAITLSPRAGLALCAAVLGVLVWSGIGPHDRLTCLDYIGDQAQLTRLIASCDAFVHANEKEPFGLIVLEAMASGRPVVAVNEGGVAELRCCPILPAVYQIPASLKA